MLVSFANIVFVSILSLTKPLYYCIINLHHIKTVSYLDLKRRILIIHYNYNTNCDEVHLIQSLQIMV